MQCVFRAKESARNQPRSQKANRREASMSRILVLIVILFIICQSIKLIPDMFEVYNCTIGDL